MGDAVRFDGRRQSSDRVLSLPFGSRNRDLIARRRPASRSRASLRETSPKEHPMAPSTGCSAASRPRFWVDRQERDHSNSRAAENVILVAQMRDLEGAKTALDRSLCHKRRTQFDLDCATLLTITNVPGRFDRIFNLGDGRLCGSAAVALRKVTLYAVRICLTMSS